MLHNLSITVTKSAMLVIIWDGVKRHQSYWELILWRDDQEFPLRVIDGPFASPWLAAMDIYQRAMELPYVEWQRVDGSVDDPRPFWGARYGINFKLAFNVKEGEEGFEGNVVHKAFTVKPGLWEVKPN